MAPPSGVSAWIEDDWRSIEHTWPRRHAGIRTVSAVADSNEANAIDAHPEGPRCEEWEGNKRGLANRHKWYNRRYYPVKSSNCLSPSNAKFLFFERSMTAPPPSDEAPPQPPLPSDEAPPVVDGIEENQAMPQPPDSDEGDMPTPTSPPSEPEELPTNAEPVRPADITAFAELFARFHSRVEKAAVGRKYRPLRDAFDAAAFEITRFKDKIDLETTSDYVIEALRHGCESGKTVVVDACLDCIHRLFEYGHIGAGDDTTNIALDARDGAHDDLVAMVCSCLEVKDEEVYLRMVQTLLTAATRTKSGLHQGTLLAAVRTIYNIFLNARMPGTRTTARVSLTQILNLVFSRMEAETADRVTSSAPDFAAEKKAASQDDEVVDAPAVEVPTPAKPAEEGGDGNEFASVLQKDAYLLFRALCKLSAKETVDTTGPDPVGLRSKLLSLELVRNLINISGPAFRSGERFVYALRQYLAPSLLINCMWNSAEVMDVSFDIFEMLLRKDTLRPLLKTEIGALFDTVVFRFLESPTAGSPRRRRAVTLLHRISSDRQTMADLFLNYDCDMESPKIFERIVSVISGAAQTSISDANVATSTPGTGQVDVRVLALTSVTQIVRSLRDWSKPIEDSKEQMRSSRIDSEENLDNMISPVSNGDGSQSSSIDDMKEGISAVRPSSSSKAVMGVISEGSDRDTTRFEEALKAKRDTAEGIILFNSKPKRGIEFLIRNGRLEEDPSVVAEFLHNAENLDAAMVGEYLGEGGTFNVNVMHAYTDKNNFTDLAFDGALRMHLSGFRLPGEAQKIDRIMEKFASRYCECNPDVFANADAAYVLAYSSIMLHTDAHNDTIKHKMTKGEFIKNNRGINDGGDVDPLFLGALYDRITTTEIKLASTKKDSTPGNATKSLNNAATAMDPAQRARQFEQESERLMAQTKILFARKRRPAQDYTYYSATNVHHARLMFETAWFPVLAAISQNLEQASPGNNSTVALCLDGFRNGIAISSTFGMATTKDAFVSSLAKFTHLNSIAEMRLKNVECVRMILAIAALEGNNLGEQWVVIVRAISQLEQVRAVASGNPGRYLLQKSSMAAMGSKGSVESEKGQGNGYGRMASLPASVHSDKNSSGMALNRRSSSSRVSVDVTTQKSGRMPIIDSKAASMATTIAESEIERIFTNSSKLSASGVADFCGALCLVAEEELGERPVPRLFCLQKIVEMAYYNMESRTRLQWSKIWIQMGPFFATAMCHSNRDVAMYAVDALRQLASKFLDKDELSNFSFQRAFLKPFEMCFSRSKNVQIRELVLTCISQIVLARAGNIKSGWKSVFSVLALAADDEIEAIMNFGWQIVESIARKYIGVLDDVFVDAVNGISAYTRAKKPSTIPFAAIGMLSDKCALSLADGHALTVLRELAQAEDGSTSPGGLREILFSAEIDAHIGAWFPLLTGLASAMQDERPDVRLAANSGLYKVLTDFGGRLSPSLWALVFRGVLAPVFDDVRHLSSSNDRTEVEEIVVWATTTGSASLKALVDVFVKHIEMTRGLLPDLLQLIRDWILQESEVVAREGMSVMARLVMASGDVFGPQDWRLVVDEVNTIFSETMPYEILGPGGKLTTADSGEKGRNEEVSDDSRMNGNGTEMIEGQANGGDEGFDDTENGEEAGGGDVNEGEGSGDGEESVKKIDFRVVRAKCVVQLLLIQLVQEIVVSFYRILSTEDIVRLSGSLERSYGFAHDFNADIQLRYSLWHTGFMNQVPNLLKQETNGLMAFLRILFWLYLDAKRSADSGATEDKVMRLCEKVLLEYIATCEDAQKSKSEERREVGARSPVVSFIVNGVMQMSHSQFEKHLPSLYMILLDLLDVAYETDVRQAVTNLFRARIAPVPQVQYGESSSASQSTIYVARPQLPGAISERVLRTKIDISGYISEAQANQDTCAALSKVGGVRSVVSIGDSADEFRVVCSGPDEMLVSSVIVLPFVNAASVDPVDDGGLD